MPAQRTYSSDVLARLAVVILSGPWTSEAIVQRCRAACGRRRRLGWLSPLAERLLAEFPGPPGLREVERILTADPDVTTWLRRASRRPYLISAPASDCMLPLLAEFRRWELPELATVGKLSAWLETTPDELDWLSDRCSWEGRRTHPASRNYRYLWVCRAGGKRRLLEAPKPRLRELQRRIQRGLLDRVPPHACAHGFRKRHSVATFAAPHVRQEFVCRIDLRNYFAEIRRPRIAALFRTLGYPQAIAAHLAALCTNAVPQSVLEAMRSELGPEKLAEYRLAFGTPHLPQGAPTSPALANLVAYRLDCRLDGLLHSAGGIYTRYADDLVFSGDRTFHRTWPRLKTTILAIVLDEGFHIRARKTKAMFRSQRQQVGGLVINEALHLPRDDYDALRACLFNCRRFGPASQNHDAHADFRAHLLGRISYVRQFHPARAGKLQRLFEGIDWPP